VTSTIPALPETWSTQPGWTKYKEGHPPEPVPFPDEDCLVFDIEECMRSGLGPTLATALSPDAWYAWVSQPLADVINGSPEPGPKTKFTPQDLINMETPPERKSPLENSKAKVRFYFYDLKIFLMC
jgi:DNA polymerase gamma 1